MVVVGDERTVQIEAQTIPKNFLDQVEATPDATCLRWKNIDESWQTKTYEELSAEIACLVSAFTAAGVKKGDHVILMMTNRYEFHALDLAALFMGAIPVSVYNTSSSQQITKILSSTEASIAFVEDCFSKNFLESIKQVSSDITYVSVGQRVEGDVVEYQKFVGSEHADLSELASQVDQAAVATMIYTSGTTGDPKGVVLDNQNIAWTVSCLRKLLALETHAGVKVLSYLPMAHIAERVLSHYIALMSGFEVTCCPDPKEVAEYAKEVKPNIIFGVPRVWEKIYARIHAVLAEDPEKAKAVREAVEAAAPLKEKMTWGTASDEDKEAYNFFDAVAFSTIRERIGLSETIVAVSGAAPLPKEILSWFRTVGVPLSEIYGLSETSGPLSWDPYKVKEGAVGLLCPGMEIKLESDGEILCRGENIFRGYYNDPVRTAEVLSDDGWFATGDIGEIDDDGYIKIVDRKKEILVTTGGKNVSPSILESSLKMIPLVQEAVAVGNGRKFVSALLTLDQEYAQTWAADKKINFDSMEDLVKNPDVLQQIETDVEKTMAVFSVSEQVKKFTLLSDVWSPDSLLLTPTSKLKRKAIGEKYSDEIELMYKP